MYYGKWKWGFRNIAVLLLTGICLLFFSGTVMAVETAWTQTSRADFEAGTAVQLDVSSSPGDIKLDIDDVDYLYALRGNCQSTFWRYGLAANTWTPLADAPDKVKWGGALASDGGIYLYAFRGGGSNDFWRYNIAANSWTVMAGAPDTVGDGGALTYNNGNIFAMRGNNTRDFWQYSIATDSWTILASTSNDIRDGGALIDDGGNYIYAFQCETTEFFWRYDIEADIWTLMADVPAPVGHGAALSYDGNRYIYALHGDSTTDFWQYDTVTDVWSIKAGTPWNVGWGGALAYATGGYIYALRGHCSQQFWQYDIATDSWEWRTNTPASVYYGGALARGGVTYFASGNLTSDTHDTGYNADFGTLSWMATLPPGTEVKFQVAANNDNSTWAFLGPDGSTDTCYTSTGSAIWDGHNGSRYVKYRAFFSTTDTGVTPVLHEVTLTCSQRVDVPTVTTDEATSIAETTAVLHGTVIDDGNEACQYRFQYGTIPDYYTADTGWSGSVIKGESFSVAVGGLGKGTKYYFRAQVKNSTGTGSGLELSLLTRPDAPVSGTFTATTISDTQINLTWVKGEGSQRTMVRRSTVDYPADIEDGFQVYFDTGTAVADIGLTLGTTYYYSAWSEVTGSQQWSNSYSTATATTSAVPPVAVGGVVFRVNKAAVIAPWLGLLISGSAAGVVIVRWWKKVRMKA